MKPLAVETMPLSIVRGAARRLSRIADMAERCVDCAGRDLDAGSPDGARVMLAELAGLVSELAGIGQELAGVARVDTNPGEYTHHSENSPCEQ